MFISDFSIRRPIITVVVMLALVVFGVFALIQLRTDEFPDVSPPIVSVAIPYPGAAPDTVEREVIDPIEEQISAISGVKKIQSNALDSFGVVTVEFVFAKDLQEATQDIRDGISQIRNDLPVEMEEPILTKFDPNDFPIVQLTLASQTLTGAELTRIADPGLTRQLRGVTGVAESPGCAFFSVAPPSQAGPLVIDNENNTYFLEVGAPNAGTIFAAVRVYYTLQVSPAPAVATFSDVPPSHPFFRFIEALVASGITAGCGGGNFCPDTPLTRGQMAVFLAIGLGLHFAP